MKGVRDWRMGLEFDEAGTSVYVAALLIACTSPVSIAGVNRSTQSPTHAARMCCTAPRPFHPSSPLDISGEPRSHTFPFDKLCDTSQPPAPDDITTAAAAREPPTLRARPGRCIGMLWPHAPRERATHPPHTHTDALPPPAPYPLYRIYPSCTWTCTGRRARTGAERTSSAVHRALDPFFFAWLGACTRLLASAVWLVGRWTRF